jgi:ribonuclease P protein component
MAAPSFGFGPEARLPSGRAYRKIFSDGRKIAARNLILWYHEGAGNGQARLGLSVSGKVGSAVRRNRLKRLTREAFRRARAGLKPADVVVYIRPGCRWLALKDAEADLSELFRKAGLVQA